MGVLVIFFLFLVFIDCMVQATWWSPTVHWRNICLITLANYENINLLLFVFVELLVSSTDIYHFCPSFSIYH